MIGLLVSVLSPALGRAKRAVESIRCASNMKQLRLAWQMDANDYQGALVPNYEAGSHGDWRSLCSTTNSWLSGAAAASDGTEGLCQRVLRPYTGQPEIYRCPADRSVWRCGDRRARRPFTVALSVWMNGGWNGSNGKAIDPLVLVRLSEIRDPAGRFTSMDEDAERMCTGAFFVERDQPISGG